MVSSCRLAVSVLAVSFWRLVATQSFPALRCSGVPALVHVRGIEFVIYN